MPSERIGAATKVFFELAGYIFTVQQLQARASRPHPADHSTRVDKLLHAARDTLEAAGPVTQREAWPAVYQGCQS